MSDGEECWEVNALGGGVVIVEFFIKQRVAPHGPGHIVQISRVVIDVLARGIRQ